MRLLLPCLALVLSCSGDVYTLRSGTGSGSLLESLDAREILRDTIEMNGVQGELAVHHTTLCWEEVRAQVKRLLGCPVLERNRNSLLIEDRHGKQLTRHYLFATSADKHPIIFSITAPERILTAKVHEWPDDFPRPTAAHPKHVMHLTKRQVDLAIFTTPSQQQTAARGYDAQLSLDGWQRLDKAAIGTGAVYLKERPTRILLFSTLVNDQGGTTAAIFMKHGDTMETINE